MSSTSLLIVTGMSEIKTAKDGRLYYSARFQSADNPFLNEVGRMFSQSKQGDEWVWKGANPKQISEIIKKSIKIPGKICSEKVEPYQLTSTDGQGQPIERTVDSYTTVVFEGELKEKVFRSMNHPIQTGESTTAVVVSPAGEFAEAVNDELPI